MTTAQVAARCRHGCTNANPGTGHGAPGSGWAGDWEIRKGVAAPRVKDGEHVIELTVPANETRDSTGNYARQAAV